MLEGPISKRCNGCLETKPLSTFPHYQRANRGSRVYIQPRCKQCHRVDKSKHCNSCNKTKHISEFYGDNGPPRPECISCRLEHKRHCTRCNNTKNISDFYVVNGRVKSTCKPCNLATTKIWREQNRDKKKKGEVAWAKKNPDKMKKINQNKCLNQKLKRWNMTLQDLQMVFDLQNGLCALCKKREIILYGGMNTHLDHDHKTGKFRGILCRVCNIGLGAFGDSSIRLEEAVSYLERK